jgi:hypothetical protein
MKTPTYLILAARTLLVLPAIAQDDKQAPPILPDGGSSKVQKR